MFKIDFYFYGKIAYWGNGDCRNISCL